MLNRVKVSNHFDGDKELPFYKSLRQIKEFDTVELHTPINELSGQLLQFNPVATEFKESPYHSFLPEYVLKYRTRYKDTGYDIVCYAYINEVDGIIECYTFETKTGIYYCVFRTDISDPSKFLFKMDKVTDKECHLALAEVLSVLGYIQNKMVDTNTVVKSERKARSAGSISTPAPQVNTKRKVRVLNADKVLYTVTSQQDNIAQIIRKYQRHKQSWNVAGHPRKLASGRVVWVRPYKKGTGPVEPTTYVIK